jgi:hypothetical protein
MIARSRKLPKGSCFLFGPRGTGKSTWLEAELPGALHVDLLDQATFLELTGHAERLGAMADARRAKVIVIDEVQKLPALLDEVHRLIERRRFRFVLTGSSARKLRRSGTNLLAGRARTIEMHPFTASELGSRWKLAHAIRYGMLPTVWVEDDPADYLKAYVGTYLREEVQQEALVRNLATLTRERHGKYASTIHHLEPNVKETPGGLRDFQLVGWLQQLREGAADPSPELREAFRFLARLRCFLHCQSRRDNNQLSFDAQDAEEFAAHTKLMLIEANYAILRKFEGRSKFTTYLTTVIQRLFFKRPDIQQNFFRFHRV